MPKIPDRWIPYKACGNVIQGTKFICFKVPLRKMCNMFPKPPAKRGDYGNPSLLRGRPLFSSGRISAAIDQWRAQRNVQTGNRDIKEIWDIPALLAKIPELGAVIDLTNTAKYYNPAELEAAGVLHKKILIPGRIIPPENTVTEFMDSVDEFLGKDCDMLIGVHCTHGLNRTGYMVCRYMRDRLGVPAKDAIKRFEKARGYQIERENYKADLLGIEPPPPDVGQETIVKPLDNKHYCKRPYNRSVVNDEDEEEYEDYNSRYDRYSRERNNKYRNTWSNGQTSRNWRSRDEVQRGTDRRQRGRSEHRRESAYDYKYDY